MAIVDELCRVKDIGLPGANRPRGANGRGRADPMAMGYRPKRKRRSIMMMRVCLKTNTGQYRVVHFKQKGKNLPLCATYTGSLRNKEWHILPSNLTVTCERCLAFVKGSSTHGPDRRLWGDN
jgi:hypothetical protein